MSAVPPPGPRKTWLECVAEGSNVRRCVECGNDVPPSSSNAKMNCDYCNVCKKITQFAFGQPASKRSDTADA